MFSRKADVFDGGFRCNPELAVTEYTAFPKTIGIPANRNNSSSWFRNKSIVHPVKKTIF